MSWAAGIPDFPHLPPGVLGERPEFVAESAGRTLLLRGSGRVAKVFLPRPDGVDRADREIGALQLLAGSPVPVPELIDHGTADGCRWVLMSELPGVSLRVQDYDSADGLAFQRFRGRMSATIHASARPPAFGVWTVDPRRSAADWARLDSSRRAELAGAVRPERVGICGRMRRQQERWLDAVDAVEPVLVHGDLGPENFLVDPAGRLVGIHHGSAAVTRSTGPIQVHPRGNSGRKIHVIGPGSAAIKAGKRSAHEQPPHKPPGTDPGTGAAALPVTL